MRLALLVGAAIALTSTAASAAINFVYISSSTAPFSSFSFSLPDNFAPAASTSNSFETALVNTDSNSGFGPVSFFDSYRFYTDAAAGGFESGFDSYVGPALFTGSTSAPSFRLGTFSLTDFEFDGQLTISQSDATGAVPEPATWAMMLMGFGAIDVALRRRRRPQNLLQAA